MNKPRGGIRDLLDIRTFTVGSFICGKSVSVDRLSDVDVGTDRMGYDHFTCTYVLHEKGMKGLGR